MSFLIPCPNCGPRDVSEFRHGGQVADGPANLPGPQRERWYHRLGCRRWLVAVRDVRTNTVLATHRPKGDEPCGTPLGEPPATPGERRPHD